MNDYDEFYLNWLLDGNDKASKHWNESMSNGTSYCYGRNLRYDEEWDKRAWQSPIEFRKLYENRWSKLNESIRTVV